MFYKGGGAGFFREFFIPSLLVGLLILVEGFRKFTPPVLRGQGGPGVKIMILFVLTYDLALVMKILKWAHTLSNFRRLSFCGSSREAWRGPCGQFYSTLEVGLGLILVVVKDMGII